MVQSLDPQILAANNNKSIMTSSMMQHSGGSFLANHQLNGKINQKNCLFIFKLYCMILGGPLVAASKMVPVPESLMSPDCPIATPLIHRGSLNISNNQQSSMMTSSMYGQSLSKSNSKTKGTYKKAWKKYNVLICLRSLSIVKHFVK